MYQEIKIILEHYDALLSQWNESNVTINNYATLLEASIKRELIEELEKLRQLINKNENELPETIQSEFKELCRLRQVRNQNTRLSFSAMPEGDCNEMYWQIGRIIFKPKTLADMMDVLLPDVKRAITVNTDRLLPEKNEFGQQRKMLDRVIVDVSENDIKGLPTDDLAIDKPGVLTGFVIDGDRIFDLKQIQEFPFALQKKLYEKLSNDQYAALKNALYNHNKDLEQLQANIQLFNKEGAVSLGEALERFISQLASSGTQFTGGLYAADRAILACAQFRQYLDMFPDKMRSEIESLESGNTSLLITLANLEKEGSSCVETASGNLKKILNDNKHARIMRYHPALNEQQMNIITDSYGKGKPLPIVGFGNTTGLPLNLKAALLGEVKISSPEGYLDFLIALPEAEYAGFFEHVTISANPALPNNLNEVLSMLTSSQVQAFFSAIVKHPEKFGGFPEVFKLVFSVNFDVFKSVLELCLQQNLFNGKSIKDVFDDYLLYQIVYKNLNPEVLLFILSLFPEQDRLNMVRKKYGYISLLEKILDRNSSPEILQNFLNLLPEQDRLKAVKERDRYGETLLYKMASSSSPDVLQTILSLYPPYLRLLAVNVSNSDNETVLHMAIRNQNPNVLLTILSLLPEHDRLTAIREEDTNGDSVVDKVAINQNPAYLQTIFSVVPEIKAELMERKRKDSFLSLLPDDIIKEMILASSVDNFNHLIKILKKLPPEKQIVFIEMVGKEKILSFLYDNGKNIDGPSFARLIKRLAPDNQMSCTVMFCNEISDRYEYQPIYKNNDILRLLPKGQKKLLNELVDTAKNADYEFFKKYLPTQSEDQRLLLIQCMGKDKLCRYVYSGKDLCNLLTVLPEDKRIPYIYWYASEKDPLEENYTIASCLNNESELVEMLTLLPSGKECDQIGSVLRNEIRENKVIYILKLIDLEIVRLQEPTKNPFISSAEKKIRAFSELKKEFQNNKNNNGIKAGDILVSWYIKNKDIINEPRNPGLFEFFKKDTTPESEKFIDRLFSYCDLKLDQEIPNKPIIK